MSHDVLRNAELWSSQGLLCTCFTVRISETLIPKENYEFPGVNFSISCLHCFFVLSCFVLNILWNAEDICHLFIYLFFVFEDSDLGWVFMESRALIHTRDTRKTRYLRCLFSWNQAARVWGHDLSLANRILLQGTVNLEPMVKEIERHLEFTLERWQHVMIALVLVVVGGR